MGHMSHVTCHMSHGTCHMSHFFFYFFFFFGQSGEAYRWRVCYQCGLPRQVFFSLSCFSSLFSLSSLASLLFLSSLFSSLSSLSFFFLLTLPLHFILPILSLFPPFPPSPSPNKHNLKVTIPVFSTSCQWRSPSGTASTAAWRCSPRRSRGSMCRGPARRGRPGITGASTVAWSSPPRPASPCTLIADPPPMKLHQ